MTFSLPQRSFYNSLSPADVLHQVMVHSVCTCWSEPIASTCCSSNGFFWLKFKYSHVWSLPLCSVWSPASPSRQLFNIPAPPRQWAQTSDVISYPVGSCCLVVAAESVGSMTQVNLNLPESHLLQRGLSRKVGAKLPSWLASVSQSLKTLADELCWMHAMLQQLRVGPSL